MKHLIATLAIGGSLLLVALFAPNPAGAEGKPSYGCPPGFIGPLTLHQYLELARNKAGFAAGAFDAKDRTSSFASVDLNHDGMICARDVAASVGRGAAPIWQYFYNIVDNDASASPG